MVENNSQRNVAVVVFYDKQGNIVVQERGEHAKIGEKYGLFGGQIEKDETPEQTMKRELMEELGFVSEKLDFWRNSSYVVAEEGKYHGWLINQAVFISPITPELERAQTHEGEGIVKMTIDEAIESKGFSIGGTEFLKVIKKDLFHL